MKKTWVTIMIVTALTVATYACSADPPGKLATAQTASEVQGLLPTFNASDQASLTFTGTMDVITKTSDDSMVTASIITALPHTDVCAAINTRLTASTTTALIGTSPPTTSSMVELSQITATAPQSAVCVTKIQGTATTDNHATAFINTGQEIKSTAAHLLITSATATPTTHGSAIVSTG